MPRRRPGLEAPDARRPCWRCDREVAGFRRLSWRLGRDRERSPGLPRRVHRPAAHARRRRRTCRGRRHRHPDLAARRIGSRARRPGDAPSASAPPRCSPRRRLCVRRRRCARGERPRDRPGHLNPVVRARPEDPRGRCRRGATPAIDHRHPPRGLVRCARRAHARPSQERTGRTGGTTSIARAAPRDAHGPCRRHPSASRWPRRSDAHPTGNDESPADRRGSSWWI